ncbi:DUF6119 family protein [Labilibaculum sp.]|uniref:DUF6119 family protein n=1 Tax=Labilibaculum sp. TaxID=2060723 RepID=UPI002AA83AEE|nr:DUF6119 family protein [Labilibaculum sp.]
MENSFFDSKTSSEIKIFQIDKLFYELKSLGSNEKIVNFIVDRHREKVKDKKSIGIPTPQCKTDTITYYSYVYNEKIKDSYWKIFLPTSITESHDFQIQKISFVLFASIGDYLFAIVGGGGIRVIKRYLNNRFGIELFEHLTIPKDDLITSITVRGISGRLTEQSEIFRNGQTLLDSLRFTEIPTKINIVLRKDLIDSVFDFMNFNTDVIHLEIGSYFFIKYRLSFEELHNLIGAINDIMSNTEPNPLSSFIRENNSTTINNLYQKILCQGLMDTMLNIYSQRRRENSNNLDIDFVHPSRIQEFYECDKYELKAKRQRNPFYTTNDKSTLFKAGLKYLFDEIGESNRQFDFDTIILGIRVYGYRGKQRITHAMFLQHITTEIRFQKKPIFHIDNLWYRVQNDFVNTINERCINMIEKNYLNNPILDIPWDREKMDEGEYNLLYSNKDNVIVLDKMLGQNIEFCDLMIEKEDIIYLVHVKDGFDAKMRDLSNQILISANRFWNDINSDNNEFLIDVIDRYNNNNNELQLDKNNFLSKFKMNKEIIFVMAYNSNKPNLKIKDRILTSKSNIAKYSLVQCAQDMTSRYSLKIVDIADIKDLTITHTPSRNN